MNGTLPPRMALPDGLNLNALFGQFQICVSQLPEKDQAEADGELIASEARQKAFALALFGWKGDTPADLMGSEVLSCGACFDRCGLWIWQPRPAVRGRRTDPDTSEFSSEREHCEYCPWMSATTQNAGRTTTEPGDELSGWQRLAKLVADQARTVRVDPPVPERPTSSSSARDEPKANEEAGANDKEESEAKDAGESETQIKERFAKLKQARKAFSMKRFRKN